VKRRLIIYISMSAAGHSTLSTAEPERLKLVLLGDPFVGKSCLAKRYTKDEFSIMPESIGVDFEKKREFLPEVGKEVSVMIWDTAGQERF